MATMRMHAPVDGLRAEHVLRRSPNGDSSGTADLRDVLRREAAAAGRSAVPPGRAGSSFGAPVQALESARRGRRHLREFWNASPARTGADRQ